MQVKTITVNAAEIMTEMVAERQGALRNSPQVQAAKEHTFAPECRVTISQEGKKRSRQQKAYAETSAETSARSPQKSAGSSRSYLPQKQYTNLREALTEMYKWNGFTGDELLERVNSTYEEIQRRAQGGIQFSVNEPSEEAKAAMEELAQKALKAEDIAIDPSRAQDLIQAAQEYQEYKL